MNDNTVLSYSQICYDALPDAAGIDSESEEEIHNSAKMKIRNQIVTTTTENGNNNLLINNNNLSPDGEFDEANGVFQADNIAILNENGPVDRKMSPARKCCFIASLLVCVFSVVIFLWVIPCSDELSCPANTERVKTHNWIRSYEKIELKGVINVVAGLRGRSKNLVFMYRGDKLFPEFADSDKRRNGIISLIGSSGRISWYDQMINEPKRIDCTLIDVDKSGYTDCLVMDEFGQMEAIDPISGQWLWHSPIYDTKNVVKTDLLDFPLVLPDINDDGVSDLLYVTSFGEKKHNKMVILSGSSGQLVGDSFQVKDCVYIHKLQIEKDYTVKYNCINNNGSEYQRPIALPQLFAKIKKGGKLVKKKMEKVENLRQHLFYGQRKNVESQRTIKSVRDKQLIVENRGKCPENCSSLVQLVEKKGKGDKIVWNITGQTMYGMQPVKLAFNNTGVSSKSAINGFVIKFWEWSLDEDNKSTRYKRKTENFNLFSHLFNKKKNWILPEEKEADEHEREKRQTFKPGTYKTRMRVLKETVKLIIFNSTDTKIENTSQSNIIQFCREDINDRNNIICQPDLNYQENSLLIADLDEDGSQELVSYYSTFVKSEDANKKDQWKLKTFVQLLRLQSELPKLYGIDIRN